MARVKTVKANLVDGHAVKYCSCDGCKMVRKGLERPRPVTKFEPVGGPFPTINFPTLPFTAKGMKGRYAYISVAPFQTQLRWVPIK